MSYRNSPDNWDIVGFDETFDIQSDGGKRVKKKDYLTSGPVPVIDQGEPFVGGFVAEASVTYNGPLPVIVFGDHTRRVKHVEFPFAVGAEGVKLLTAANEFYSRFLDYHLRAFPVEDRGYGRHFQYLRKQTFVRPPIDEQRDIVSKLDELFSDLDAGVAALERAQANLKRYRAAVLKAAVEGKLTEQWRAEHPDVEPASALLERILAERRAKWEEEQFRKYEAKGKKPPKGWQDRYKHAPQHEQTHLPKIPSGWCWMTLGMVAWDVKDGPHYSPKYVDEGIPFISGRNVRPEGIDFSSAKFITPALHEELSQRCKPEYGDLLYTKGGTTGIARVNWERVNFNVWVHVAVLKLVSAIEPDYIQHALNSPLCYAQSQRYTHGVGNQDLGLTRMVKIALPLPPMDEQQEIIRMVDEQTETVRRMVWDLAANVARAARLRQAILGQAFRGVLLSSADAASPGQTELV